MIWCRAWQDLPWNQEGVQMRQKHWLNCLNWETWVTLFSLLNQENKAFWFLVYYYSDKSQGVLRFKISWVAEQYSQFMLWIFMHVWKVVKRGRLKDSSPSETPALILMMHFLFRKSSVIKIICIFCFRVHVQKMQYCYVDFSRLQHFKMVDATENAWVWLSWEIWICLCKFIYR